ncbi:sigma-70 family RNA polymerase sigma factor [Flavobacteriaceae sp. LMIT009]
MDTKDIWTSYHEDVRRFIGSKIKEGHIVDDLLQETFIKVHTKLDSLKDESKVKSWIFMIARNTMFDYFKNRDFISEGNAIIVEPDDDVIDNHTEKDCLRGIIKRLPKKYRDPLFLSDIRGLKQKDVAEQLKLELPTAKSRIQRARKLIAKGYMDCCDYKMNQKGHLVGEVKQKEDCKVCG